MTPAPSVNSARTAFASEGQDASLASDPNTSPGYPGGGNPPLAPVPAHGETASNAGPPPAVLPMDPALAEATLLACSRATVEFAESNADQLFEQAREVFFIAARDAASPEEEGEQIALMEEVEDLADPMSATFVGAIRNAMEALTQGERPTAPDHGHQARDDSEDGELALVDTMKVDDVLALTRALRHFLPLVEEAQQAVRRRFCELTGNEIDDGANPVSLQNLCTLFHESLESMGATRPVRAAILEAFEQTVLANLPGLLTELQVVEPGADAIEPAPRVTAVALEPMREAPVHDAADDEPSKPADDAVETNTLPGIESAMENGPAQEPGAGMSGPAGAEPEDDPSRVDGVIAAIAREPGADARTTPCSGPHPSSDSRAADIEQAVAQAVAMLESAFAEAGFEEQATARLRRFAAPVLRLCLLDGQRLDDQLETARHDPTTGLLDAAAFQGHLERQLSGQRPHVLCLIALDGFETLRETWGTSVTGRLCRRLTQILHKHAGERVVASRLYDATFAAILDGYQLQRGWRFAQRFERTVRELDWTFADRTLEASVSIGLFANPGDEGNGPQVMRAATQALRAAQSNGGAQVVMHDPTQPASKGKPLI